MEEAGRVLLVPIFRRHWLWYAWGERTAAAAIAGAGRAAAAAAAKPPRNWRQGQNLEEKMQLLGQQARAWIQGRLWTEWRKLETAAEGTLRNRGYKMAQAVLAREDPQETFLKNLPAKAAPLEVIYPTAFREKLVRRRLRHVAAEGRRRHTSRLVAWVLAMVPQLPLMATPLPNITVYYTGYRIYSHYRALQGCKALEELLEQLNSKQMRSLRDELLLLQEQTPGLKYPRDEWPAKLIRREHRYLDMLERMTRIQRQRELRRLAAEGGELPAAETAGGGAADPAPLLTFTPSHELSELARPLDRLATPLGDEAAMKIGRLFGQPTMMELVARARKRAVGSMFPSLLSPGGSGRRPGPGTSGRAASGGGGA